MQGHHQNAFAFFHSVKIRIKSNFFEKTGKFCVFCLCLVFYKVGFKFAHVFKSGFAFQSLSTKHFGVSGFFAEFIKKFFRVKILRRFRKGFYHIRKAFEHGAFFHKVYIFVRVLKNFKKAHTGNVRNMLRRRKGCSAYAPFGFVDYAFKAQVIRMVFYNGHIGKHILDFLAFVKAQTADDLIRHAGTHKSFFKAVGLGMHTVKHRKIAVFCAFANTFKHYIGNIFRFSVLINTAAYCNFASVSVGSPKVFAFSLGIVGNNFVCGRKYILRGAIVLFQPYHLCPGELSFERKDIFYGSSAEFINGLIIITHNAKVFILCGQKRHKHILHMVCILIFVHHDILPAVLIIFQHFRVGFKKPYRFAKQVVKIQSARFVQFLLISRIYPCGNFHTVIAVSLCNIRHVLRRFQPFFCMAYGTKQGFWLKLLFFHIKIFKAFFHYSDAVIRIINGKAFRQIQKFRISAQNAHAHTVKSRSKNLLRIRAKLCHKAVFKFIRGLVCKSYGKNIPWAHAGFYKPCNPCNKHGGFAAAGPCKHKKRTFFMHNRLHLAVVKRIV